jgi:tetratricopeptide (TPR) repeat protein
VDIPLDLPQDRYDIGLYVFGVDEAAGVWPASSIGSTPVTNNARVIEGEARWVRDITVTDETTMVAGYDGALTRVDELLTALRCEPAEQLWKDGRRHLPNAHPSRQDEDDRIRDGLASCYASQAETVEAEKAADLLLQARAWSPRNRDLIRIGETLADAWVDEAESLVDAGNQRAAVRAYERVLVADPTRSWDRRHLEELRAVYIAELQAARDVEQERKEAERDAREAEREAREAARQPGAP